jgi:hypothetical protein
MRGPYKPPGVGHGTRGPYAPPRPEDGPPPDPPPAGQTGVFAGPGVMGAASFGAGLAA